MLTTFDGKTGNVFPVPTDVFINAQAIPENIHRVWQLIRSKLIESACALIQKIAVEELDTLFLDEKQKKTCLLCEAVLAELPDVVKALLQKKVKVQLELGADPATETENILTRLFYQGQFGENFFAIATLLIQNKAALFFTKRRERRSVVEIFNLKVGSNLIASYKRLMDMMGDDFFEHLLYLPTERSSTLLYKIGQVQQRASLYAFLCYATQTYFAKKNYVEEEMLALFLLSTGNAPEIKAFIQGKLARQSYFFLQTKHEQLIETNYSDRTSYMNILLQSFHYPNEAKALEVALSSPSLLSLLTIKNVHDRALASGDQKGQCASIYQEISSGIGRVGISCSLGGFFEIEKCAQQKWFDLEPYTNDYGTSFRHYLIWAVPSKSKLQSLVSEYNRELKATQHRVEKLKLIIKLASDLSRIHFFCDANKRTSYLIFLAECIKNGFLPALIDNRLVLRSKSQQELFYIVLNRMEKLLESINETKGYVSAPIPNEAIAGKAIKQKQDHLRQFARHRSNELERLQPWYYWDQRKTKKIRV